MTNVLILGANGQLPAIQRHFFYSTRMFSQPCIWAGPTD